MTTTVPSQSKAWFVFSRSNTGVVGWIPLKEWMSAFILSVRCPVYVAALWRAQRSPNEPYRLYD
jgi:hypothetical protein